MDPIEKARWAVLIRRAREARKLSRFHAAVAAGVSPQTIQMAEHGAASEAMIARLAKALGVRLPKTESASER